jgi:nitroreductase
MRDHPAVPFPSFRRLPEPEMLARAAAIRDELRERRTCRYFAPDPVPREVIARCIEAAGTAPSGANHQPWFFSAISDPEKKRLLREAAEAEERAFYAGKASREWLEALGPLGTDPDKSFIEVAPWVIGVFAQRRGGVRAGLDLKNYYINESVGIACGMLLAALHHAGLATLTHTPNPMNFLNEVCGRPPSEKPYLLLVAGYPADDATVPTHALIKKSLEDIAEFL